jgi:uridine kinase
VQPVIIGISGGSASGKTTLAKKIANVYPNNSIIISLDNYYKDYSDPSIDKATINYDQPGSLDVRLFIEHLTQLKRGEAVDIPDYNFCTHSRLEKTIPIEAHPLIIVEGLFLFNIGMPERTYNLKIFVDAPDDIRFIRRLERDVHQRSRSVDSIVAQYLKTVRPMHYKHVLPNKTFAQVTYNTEGQTKIAFKNLIALIGELGISE